MVQARQKGGRSDIRRHEGVLFKLCGHACDGECYGLFKGSNNEFRILITLQNGSARCFSRKNYDSFRINLICDFVKPLKIRTHLDNFFS